MRHAAWLVAGFGVLVILEGNFVSHVVVSKRGHTCVNIKTTLSFWRENTKIIKKSILEIFVQLLYNVCKTDFTCSHSFIDKKINKYFKNWGKTKEIGSFFSYIITFFSSPCYGYDSVLNCIHWWFYFSQIFFLDFENMLHLEEQFQNLKCDSNGPTAKVVEKIDLFDHNKLKEKKKMKFLKLNFIE